ncbi:MAG: trans-2-enoyl-CoA reductase family protein [Paludibacter sp.]|nr:trans-2-enoyl-CoA reductase family protein [Paludibacter sp.]
MIVKSKMRGFISLTTHPVGCEFNVGKQIEYVKKKGLINGPKKVLVIGASTGFGLASRITSAFANQAATIGVFFEKEPQPEKTATAGWYNSAAFTKFALAQGLYAKNINGDAFSDEIKRKTIELIKADLGQVDMVVYSLASPVRTHPVTGVTHRSVLKPIGQPYTNKTVDFHSGNVTEVSIDPANEEEIANTVQVMGGEDWEMWINAMQEAGVLAEGVITMAYSYIGPSVTEPVYRKGTIGMAKDHLEATAGKLTESLAGLNGKAYVSVNKALVTQASSAIPIIPLYISILFKVMKAKHIHEGCIEQIQRLYADKLFNGGTVPTDEKGRIRVDDWEMRDDVQAEVAELWENATSESIHHIGDLNGYGREFKKLFGFGFNAVDYHQDVNEMVEIENLV